MFSQRFLVQENLKSLIHENNSHLGSMPQFAVTAERSVPVISFSWAITQTALTQLAFTVTREKC